MKDLKISLKNNVNKNIFKNVLTNKKSDDIINEVCCYGSVGRARPW